MIAMHQHRYFRRAFGAFLLCHVAFLYLTAETYKLKIPVGFNPAYSYLQESMQSALDRIYQLWPFPTFAMSESTSVMLSSVLHKLFELAILVFYFADLLPKILLWRNTRLWKCVNAFLVLIMVLQVGLIAREYAFKSPHPLPGPF